MQALYAGTGRTPPTDAHLLEVKRAQEEAWSCAVDASGVSDASRTTGAVYCNNRLGLPGRARAQPPPAKKVYMAHEGPDPLVPTAFDRPDIVARAFQGRLNALLDVLTKLGVLGRVRAITYNVEWQARGAFCSSSIVYS